LYLARQAVEYGIVDCALALGFEKMAKGKKRPFFNKKYIFNKPVYLFIGSLTSHFNDRTSPLGKFNFLLFISLEL
jgi:hypothetical protein